MKKTVRKTSGLVLIAIGLLAIPIPVIPGIPLIAAGALLLGADRSLFSACRTRLQKLQIWRKNKNENELPDVPAGTASHESARHNN